MNSQALPIAPQLNDDPLAQYALQLLRQRPCISPLDDVLHEMESIALDESIPIIGPLEGAIIQMFVNSTEPGHHILDIGTAVGYSALWLARAITPDSHVTSIEIDPQRAKRARQFIHRAGLEEQITVLVGDVFDILPTLPGKFDVILQDVIKHAYFGSDSRLALQLLDLCLAHLRGGGLLLGDNAFCLGEVLLSPNDHLPKQVLGIQAYNEAVAGHPQLQSVIVPVRDGLWVSRYTG